MELKIRTYEERRVTSKRTLTLPETTIYGKSTGGATRFVRITPCYTTWQVKMNNIPEVIDRYNFTIINTSDQGTKIESFFIHITEFEQLYNEQTNYGSSYIVKEFLRSQLSALTCENFNLYLKCAISRLDVINL